MLGRGSQMCACVNGLQGRGTRTWHACRTRVGRANDKGGPHSLSPVYHSVQRAAAVSARWSGRALGAAQSAAPSRCYSTWVQVLLFAPLDSSQTPWKSRLKWPTFSA
eukprot:475849-Prymnesium_polylepis.1